MASPRRAMTQQPEAAVIIGDRTHRLERRSELFTTEAPEPPCPLFTDEALGATALPRGPHRRSGQVAVHFFVQDVF